MTAPARIRPGSAVRGAGVAVACLTPGLAGRARAVLASYVAGWPLGRPALQPFMLVPDEHEEPWKRAVVPFATSGASWTALMLVVVSAVRRSALPAPVAGMLLGGAVALGDSLLAGAFEKTKARAAEAAAARDAEASPAPDQRDQ